MNDRQILTRAETVALIKKQPAGTRFAMHVGRDAPIAGEEDKVFSWGLHGTIRVSRAQAIAFVKSCLSDSLEERGARIPSSVYVHDDYRCFWLL